MGLFGEAGAWRRRALLVVGLVFFATAASPRADALDAMGSFDVGAMSSEPFGLPVVALAGGGLRAKWLEVAHRIDDERVQLALCDGDRDRCVSDAALKLLAIVDEGRASDGRARLGQINRAINLAIHPMSDLAQYGEIDVWSSPLVTVDRGFGDCEDYAIAKFVALRLAGVAAEDLRIVVMHDVLQNEDHAVAAARLDGRWLVLDNRRMAMIDDANVRNYQPLFVIGDAAVMKYLDAPGVAALPDRDAAPATALNEVAAQ
jgi:predicted transglutaminase-like cysteine proteinase